jgi:5'-nucleotidase
VLKQKAYILKPYEYLNPDQAIVHVDLDGVGADFDAMFPVRVSDEEKEARMNTAEFWRDMPPVRHAVPAINWLDKHFNVIFLSTAPWDNPVAWMEKRLWIERYFPNFKKRLVLSHFKNLMMGDYLIDDRTKNGAAEFPGELIPFGSKGFETWAKVCAYLAQKELNGFNI